MRINWEKCSLLGPSFLTRVILIHWSIHINLLRKFSKQKSIQFILPILTHLSEFERFLKNSKNRKVQVLCAITFGGIAMHLKVIAAFKSKKIMFFKGFDKASILDVRKHEFLRFEGRNHFQMHRNATKSYGAQQFKFSIFRIFEKTFKFAQISQNGQNKLDYFLL